MTKDLLRNSSNGRVGGNIFHRRRAKCRDKLSPNITVCKECTATSCPTIVLDDNAHPLYPPFFIEHSSRSESRFFGWKPTCGDIMYCGFWIATFLLTIKRPPIFFNWIRLHKPYRNMVPTLEKICRITRGGRTENRFELAASKEKFISIRLARAPINFPEIQHPPYIFQSNSCGYSHRVFPWYFQKY